MALKGNSPLLGYNTNVRHKGVLCHVQTEDSGAARPHVTTHLFTAGVIIASKRRSYTEHVGEDNLEPLVRKMMQEQHKQMCIALRDGEFDDALNLGDTQEIVLDRPLEELMAEEHATGLAGAAQQEAPSTAPAEPPRAIEPPHPVESADEGAEKPRLELPSFHLSDDFDSPPPPAATQVKPILPAQSTYREMPSEVVRTPAPTRPNVPPRAESPPTLGRTPQPLVRTPAPAARRALTPSPAQPEARRPLTPSPARTEARRPLTPSPAQPEARRPLTPSPAQAESPGRYSSARPALFTQGKTPPAQQAPFGGEHISDKSLDEVILAYLAEEVDDE